MSTPPDATPFHVSEADGTTVHFTAGAVLTDATIEALGRRLAARTTARECPSVTLDLAGVVALSSAALGKLLALDRAVRAAGGRLILADPTPAVRRVFKLTRLDTVLDVRAAEPVAV